jgi:hypothetical protein
MVATSHESTNLQPYRPVKPLAYELQDIINVYIEEQLCLILPLSIPKVYN